MDRDDPAVAAPPIACSLTTPELRARGAAVRRELAGGIREIREEADGYALRFPGDADWLARLAAFIGFERACCPFFTFELRCEPGQGPLWLTLRGPAGVKPFVVALLGTDAR